MLLPIWNSRTYQIAQYLIVGLYPARAGEHRAARRHARVARGQRATPPAALRRLVDENVAGVERALAVQDRDAAVGDDRMPRPLSVGAEASVVRIVTMITTCTSVDPTIADPAFWAQVGACFADIGWTRSAVAGIILGAFIIGWILKFVIRRVVNRIVNGAKIEGERRRHAGAGALAARRDPARPAHAHARTDPAEHRQRHDRHRRAAADRQCARTERAGSLTLLTAAIGAGLGFGAQNIVKDVLNGIFIVAEDQVGIGDVVDLGLATGIVEYVSVRVTHVRDVNGTLWYVRNGEITPHRQHVAWAGRA